MRSILFFSRFPIEGAEKADGEMQRVLIIDRLAKREGYTRTYMHLQFRSLQARMARPADMHDVEVHLLSVFNPQSWFKVIGLIKNNYIAYFHSLHNYKFAWLLRPWMRHMRTVLDLHGIVPEENLFLGQPLRAAIYGWLERRAMRHIDRFVSVSTGMTDYLLGKYPSMSRDRFSLLPMIRGAERPYDPNVEKEQREVIGLPPDTPVAIYAGNTQKWQNIDTMIEVIARCGDRMRVIILSSAIDEFRLRLRARGIDNVFLCHATQDELYKFYSVANYGFLLRDDNIVNNVANPTKLVEYLKYGIVPVVITTKTSDLKPFEVEVLPAEELCAVPLSAQRSFRNIEVFSRYYCEDNYLLSKVIGDVTPVYASRAGSLF
jgi:glycosyltransferase involved in cell wall biosynthesis